MGKNYIGKDKGRWIVRHRMGKDLWARVVYQNYVLNGVSIPEGYVIHHKNSNIEDDSIENLVMLPDGIHRSIHNTGKYIKEETRIKISNVRKGKGHPWTEESKAKLSASRKGIKLPPISNETRIRLSTAATGKRHTQETKDKISHAHKMLVRTEESKEHIRKLNKSRIGVPLSEETKKKLTIINKIRQENKKLLGTEINE